MPVFRLIAPIISGSFEKEMSRVREETSSIDDEKVASVGRQDVDDDPRDYLEFEVLEHLVKRRKRSKREEDDSLNRPLRETIGKC